VHFLLQCYERSLECKARALGEHHPEYATSLAHLAEVLRLQVGGN
jgi:hypothetical protein